MCVLTFCEAKKYHFKEVNELIAQYFEYLIDLFPHTKETVESSCVKFPEVFKRSLEDENTFWLLVKNENEPVALFYTTILRIGCVTHVHVKIRHISKQYKKKDIESTAIKKIHVWLHDKGILKSKLTFEKAPDFLVL